MLGTEVVWAGIPDTGHGEYRGNDGDEDASQGLRYSPLDASRTRRTDQHGHLQALWRRERVLERCRTRLGPASRGQEEAGSDRLASTEVTTATAASGRLFRARPARPKAIDAATGGAGLDSL